MNRHQRHKNRANARSLAAMVKSAKLQLHTCENCGEKGGHWVSTSGISLAALITGQDDQEGFWTCPKLYGPDGRRLQGEPVAVQKPAELTVAAMKRRGRYNWKGQPERLIYLGHNWSGNGYWHQFALVEVPSKVWCEVLSQDLHSLEETTEEETHG